MLFRVTHPLLAMWPSVNVRRVVVVKLKKVWFGGVWLWPHERES